MSFFAQLFSSIWDNLFSIQFGNFPITLGGLYIGLFVIGLVISLLTYHFGKDKNK